MTVSFIATRYKSQARGEDVTDELVNGRFHSIFKPFPPVI